MDSIKRFIDIWVPVTTCNLRCHYCYITQKQLFSQKLPTFKYSPETFRKGLSKDRLGGVCMINMCGGGETLLPPLMPQYIKALLEEGHYVMVVTNGTVTKAFNEIITFPEELRERLFFKFSYHYLEFRRKEMFNVFFTNIRKVRDANISFTLEATPTDELIPYIPEMKALAVKEVGAACHITVARDEHTHIKIPLLTHLSREEYRQVWSQFDSPLFDYKLRVFGEKRREFCYAGDWTCVLNMGSGELLQCYSSLYTQNIFDDVTKPIRFKAIGHCCCEPHCFNAHAFLAFGAIPAHRAPSYRVLRDRTCADGSHWVSPQMGEFMDSTLVESNKEYSVTQKIGTDIEMAFRKSLFMLKRYTHYIVSGK